MTTIWYAEPVVRQWRDDIAVQVRQLERPPALTIIHVGHNEASTIYVKRKQELGKELCISVDILSLPAETSVEQIKECINRCNEDPLCDGILVQLPLPTAIYEATSDILSCIALYKDVDGLHPHTLGQLWHRQELFVPSTPLGIMRLLHFYLGSTEGMSVSLVGSSNLVGVPLAALCLAYKSTPTLLHKYSKNLMEHTRHADIVVAAAGVPHLITKEYVSPHAAIIDVGIHRNKEGKIIGDVHPSVIGHVKAVSAVPGGVGPMTTHALMHNVVKAAWRKAHALTEL